MSFLSVLKSIGHVVATAAGVETQFAPVVGAIPVAGSLINTIFNSIVAVEGLITAANQGPLKKQIVTAIVSAQHPEADKKALSTTIDNVVAGMNTVDEALTNVSAALAGSSDASAPAAPSTPFAPAAFPASPVIGSTSK